MRRLDRHIGSAVLLGILAVLAVILGLDLLFSYINELDDVEGGYGPLQALVYTLLSLPARVHELLPLAALVGCLVGLGRQSAAPAFLGLGIAGAFAVGPFMIKEIFSWFSGT